MSISVCLSADTIGYPEGGGHFWVYLNWALGLRSLGCKIYWLESVGPKTPEEKLTASLVSLKSKLERYKLADCLAVHADSEKSLDDIISKYCMHAHEVFDADLFLNLRYALDSKIVGRFKRSALIDIDPGLLQMWMDQKQICVAPHDYYFTIGENISQSHSTFSNKEIRWIHTPPCVALDWWPIHGAEPNAPLTTISHWNTDEEWIEDSNGIYRNDKRSGFLSYLDIPSFTNHPLELALSLGADEEMEKADLMARGWRVVDSYRVSSTPWDYQHYIQGSLGEFSCAKPSYIKLRNAWISDRTICYLASGKPAVVQHTGESRYLPESSGLFRFRNSSEALKYIDQVVADYDRQKNFARQLAEEYFDAKKVINKIIGYMI